jgi:hypothetical protein
MYENIIPSLLQNISTTYNKNKETTKPPLHQLLTLDAVHLSAKSLFKISL